MVNMAKEKKHARKLEIKVLKPFLSKSELFEELEDYVSVCGGMRNGDGLDAITNCKNFLKKDYPYVKFAKMVPEYHGGLHPSVPNGAFTLYIYGQNLVSHIFDMEHGK